MAFLNLIHLYEPYFKSHSEGATMTGALLLITSLILYLGAVVSSEILGRAFSPAKYPAGLTERIASQPNNLTVGLTNFGDLKDIGNFRLFARQRRCQTAGYGIYST